MDFLASSELIGYVDFTDSYEIWAKCSLEVNKGLTGLRRLERVFRCYIVCETMEDYKEGCSMVWANYMSPCNSNVGLYFKGTCDVISVTMATHKVN